MWVLEYYDLIWILVISDLKVKYQSSVLGFLWSLLNPLLWLLVLYVVFRNVRNITNTRLLLRSDRVIAVECRWLALHQWLIPGMNFR